MTTKKARSLPHARINPASKLPFDRAEVVAMVVWAATSTYLQNVWNVDAKPWAELSFPDRKEMRDGVRWLVNHPTAGAKDFAECLHAIDPDKHIAWTSMYDDTRLVIHLFVKIVRTLEPSGK